MSARELRAFFEAHREDAGGLVLATVYETLGATYSKAGAQMLISGSGQFQGMLSGGCLEGDLAERARQVIGSGDAQRVTYDLREDDESLWGLGVGCEGLMRIFLQPLRAVDAFAPFPAMLEILAGDETGAALTIVASDDPEVMPGASLTGTVWPPQAAGIDRGFRDGSRWQTIVAANAAARRRNARAARRGAQPAAEYPRPGCGTRCRAGRPAVC